MKVTKMILRFYQVVRNKGFFKALRITGKYIFARALLTYYRLRAKDGFVLKKILGNKMYLDVSDVGLSRELLLNGVREKMQTEILQKTVKEGMTIVDAGANLGYYALLEAAIVGEKGKIYAIEPIPRNFDILNKNIKVNNYEEIVDTFEIAVSNRSGISKIAVTEASNEASMVTTDQRSESYDDMLGEMTKREIEIRTITLDEFLEDKRPADYIRMDIEGYEVEALEGMHKTLRSDRPLTLHFELHPTHLKDPMRLAEKLKELINLGFKPIAIMHRDGTELIPCEVGNLIETVLKPKVLGVFLQKG